MLTVGVDSYVTLDEANQYIDTHYASTERVWQIWDRMLSRDKESLLRRSCFEIEQQPFVGYKLNKNQTLEFPRTKYGENVTRIDIEVKYAQIENALCCLDESANKREQLQEQGVKSYSIGGLSESFGDTPQKPLRSFRALKLLSKWLGGGYRVV